jgi:hypothetical protein
MYLAVFCLLTVVGSAIAWRRNPLYSAGLTIRFLVTTIVTLAGVMGGIIASIDLTANRSIGVQLGTILTVTLLGTIAMIYAIVTVTRPKIIPLPASAPTVHLYRSRVYLWARRAAGAAIVLAIPAAVLPGDLKIVDGIIGGMFVFVAAVCLFGGYVAAGDMDRALAALEFHPWVKWQYSADEWAQWTDVEFNRMTATPQQFEWRRDWAKVLWLCGLATVAVPFTSGSLQFKTTYVVCAWAVIFVVVAFATWANKKTPTWKRASLAKAPLEATFGDEGIFCEGKFTPWLSAADYLISAAIDQREPRSLVFRFEKALSYQQFEDAEYVLLPKSTTQNIADDLARLQRELTAKCPTASIALA